MNPTPMLPSLHEHPGLFLLCHACGQSVRGTRYCERCTEEIEALNENARRKSVQTGKPAKLIVRLPLPTQEQCIAHVLAIVIVLLRYLMSLSLQLK